MDYSITDNGNLKFTLDADEREELAEAIADKNHVPMWDVFEMFRLTGNTELEFLDPETIGALTESPILGVPERDEDGEVTDVGNVWWFPNYMVCDPAEDLAETGETIFTAAPENRPEDSTNILMARK